MKDRIKQIIDTLFDGKIKNFIAVMGWSNSYAYNVMRVGVVGIKPVMTIIEKIPRLDARWLLTGEGEMLMPEPPAIDPAKLSYIISMEPYMPVMTKEEEERLTSGETFTDEEIQELKQRLKGRASSAAVIIAAACAKQLQNK